MTEQVQNKTLGAQVEDVSVLRKLMVSRKTDIDKMNTNCLCFLKALQMILMSAKVENHCPY